MSTAWVLLRVTHTVKQLNILKYVLHRLQMGVAPPEKWRGVFIPGVPVFGVEMPLLYIV